MANTEGAQRIERVRRFNRFYTRLLGLLQEHLLRSPFSLTEARLIYELAHHEGVTATELGAELGLDAGYLSRTLAGLRRRGLVARAKSVEDARQVLLRLTEKGQKAFAGLNAASSEEVRVLLAHQSDDDQKRLVGAMETIERLLSAETQHRVPYILRPPQPGDLGWVVQRHGALYAHEYGWDERFEGLVADVIARYVEEYDPRRERCWIAEREGENVGCVFVVQKTPTIAQLRLLLVDPSARGLGIGSRLVDECIRFARQVGY